MKRRLIRAFLCISGTVGIAYGCLTMLLPIHNVHAGSGCCTYDSDCGNTGNEYCAFTQCTNLKIGVCKKFIQ